MATYENIGKRIREARTKRGITQTELAKILCISRNTLINYEDGKTNPGVWMYKKILEELRVEPDDVDSMSKGERILYARLKRGIGQRELARMAGTNRSLLSQYETGKKIPSDRIYMKLLNALECEETAEKHCELSAETLEKVELLNDLGIETLTTIIDNMVMLPMYQKKEENA